jgi:hypothetical protein
MRLWFKIGFLTFVTIYLFITTMMSGFIFAIVTNRSRDNLIHDLMSSILIPHLIFPATLWDIMGGK